MNVVILFSRTLVLEEKNNNNSCSRITSDKTVVAWSVCGYVLFGEYVLCREHAFDERERLITESPRQEDFEHAGRIIKR